MDVKNFSEKEFGGLNLGDERLNKRAVDVATMINKSPQSSFPNASNGKKYKLKGLYRFFQNDKVTDQSIIEKHYQNTILRCLETTNPILLITDSTFMAPAKKNTIQGLKTKGTGINNNLRIHYMIAVDAITEDVLGITNLSIIGDDVQKVDERMKKECDIWALTTEKTLSLAKKVSGDLYENLKKRFVFIADREADAFHLYEDLEKLGIKFVIRLAYRREILNQETGELNLYSELRDEEIPHGPPFDIEIYKNNKKEKIRVQKTILSKKTVLPPRRNRSKKSKKYPCYTPKLLNMIFIREVNPDDEENALEWRVFTNLPIDTFEDSDKVVTYYVMRWVIEELNKCAKTGVLLEDRQFTTLDHLKPAISLIFVVAWRILCIRNMADKKENHLASKVFNSEELDFLKHRLKKPLHVLMVKDVLSYIAKEGGYLGQYKRPGWIVLWKGFSQFILEVKGFSFAKEIYGAT